MSEPQPIYLPSPDRVERSRMTAFRRLVESRHGVALPTYDDLWQWSVAHLPEFWAAVWDFFGIAGDYDQVLADEAMPGARWFTGAQVNFGGWILDQGDPDEVAIVSVDESGEAREWTRAQLTTEALGLATTLRRNGIGEGDVVAGYLPNVGEAIVAFLATATVGATWTSVGQDYAPGAAVDRFGQLAPVALVCADGYTWNGTAHDRVAASEELRAALPSVRLGVMVRRSGRDSSPAGDPTAPVAAAGWMSYDDAVADPDPAVRPVPLAFDAPLWVLFSSGTTGLPKGLVHGHGGVLVEALKTAGLHEDLQPGDRYFWFTSPSWVMWNTQLHALAVGASVVCYDGSPTHPSPDRLWQIVADHGVTLFGVSPGFLQASEGAGLDPAREHDLSRLRAMGSTGAPLPAHSFAWVRDHVGDLPLWSLSGGTDVASAFVSGAPLVPVWAGEISTRCLGVAVAAWDDEGRPLVGEVGELVVTRPMPSMPLRLWGDDDGSRYQDSYLATYPGVWRQGDWITVTERGSVVIHGRSDATLNRNGVRMGSADIYAAVERHPAVVEALVVGCELPDGGYWMPLFVHLAEGQELTDELVAELREEIRRAASPRHVPDEVIAVEGVPHTRTGKKLEVPVKRLLQGAALEKVAQAQAVDRPELLRTYVGLGRGAPPTAQGE